MGQQQKQKKEHTHTHTHTQKDTHTKKRRNTNAKKEEEKKEEKTHIHTHTHTHKKTEKKTQTCKKINQKNLQDPIHSCDMVVIHFKKIMQCMLCVILAWCVVKRDDCLGCFAGIKWLLLQLF